MIRYIAKLSIVVEFSLPERKRGLNPPDNSFVTSLQLLARRQ